jgi:hypothetical protein
LADAGAAALKADLSLASSAANYYAMNVANGNTNASPVEMTALNEAAAT